MRRFLDLCICFVVVLGLSGNAALAALWTGYLEPARAFDWATHTGVQAAATAVAGYNCGTSCADGVPDRQTICTTLGVAGQLDTFAQSVTPSDITNAIQTCPEGQVVKLNAGTYTLGSAIRWGTNSTNPRNNVTLRGAGANQTHLLGAGSQCFYFPGLICMENGNVPWTDGNTEFNNNNIVPGTNLTDWTAGYAQGATVITVSNGAIVPGAGSLIFLDELHDTTAPTNVTTPFVSCAPQYIIGSTACTSGRGPSTSPRSIHEGHVVVSKNGNQITITPPLAYTAWTASKSPKVWWTNNRQNFMGNGVEDLSVENTSSNGLQSGIHIRACIGCYVKNVRTVRTGRNHITFIESIWTTVRSNYMHGNLSNGTGTTTNYGIECNQSWFNRVENNIGQHFTTPYIINGCVGTVYGYNYALAPTYNEPFDFQLCQFMPAHGGSAGMNLFEGNQGNCGISDLAHGTAPYVTYYRNRFYGKPLAGTNDTLPASPMVIRSWMRMTNMMGNVLGFDGFHTQYEASQVPPGVNGNCDTSVYDLGYGGSGCAVNSSGYDSFTVTSALRWQNCDYATDTCRQQASEIPAGHLTPPSAIPTSLYLTARPSWFRSVSWPPIGPDVTGGVEGPLARAKNIPAEECYRLVMNGPANGDSGATGTIASALAFDPATCYGSVVVTPPPPAPQQWSPVINLRLAMNAIIDFLAFVFSPDEASAASLEWSYDTTNGKVVPATASVEYSNNQSGPWAPKASIPSLPASYVLDTSYGYYRVSNSAGSSNVVFYQEPPPSPTGPTQAAFDALTGRVATVESQVAAITTKDTAQDNAIATLMTKNTTQDSSISDLNARLLKLEAPTPPATSRITVKTLSQYQIEVTCVAGTAPTQVLSGTKRTLTCP